VVAAQGERDTRFYAAVDGQSVNVFKIYSMLVAPAFDTQGKLRMIIHLVNKKNQGDIGDMDVAQVDFLTPAIAETLRAADEQMRVTNIAAGLVGHMSEMKASVSGKSSTFMVDSSMPMISTSVRYISDLIKMMVNNKKRNVFEEQSVALEVLDALREAQNYQEGLFERQREADRELERAMM